MDFSQRRIHFLNEQCIFIETCICCNERTESETFATERSLKHLQTFEKVDATTDAAENTPFRVALSEATALFCDFVENRQLHATSKQDQKVQT